MVKKKQTITGLSLFSGAGGMDVGFQSAGVDVLWANDFDRAACETYSANGLGDIEHGDINQFIPSLKRFKGDLDIVFGGPPCQGFSVAGKMDPNDLRSQLVWSYFSVVDLLRPKAFVMENVKALAENDRWKPIREKLISSFRSIGYGVNLTVLIASDFGVPQKRERMFLVGVREDKSIIQYLDKFLISHKSPGKSVRETISHLGPPGSCGNDMVCNAGITLAATPILRKSPYAGMLFNGLGRPLNLEKPSTTLPASMGGNKTHIVDQSLLKKPKGHDWIREYHRHLMSGGQPYDWKSAPDHLRRLTVQEALLLQTFPEGFIIKGSKSSAYRLVGNAVPCLLAKAVASTVIEMLLTDAAKKEEIKAHMFDGSGLPLFEDTAKAA